MVVGTTDHWLSALWLVLAAWALALPICANAQIYVGGEASGASIVLSNFASRDTPQLLIAAPVEAGPGAAPNTRALGSSRPARSARLPVVSADLRSLIEEVAAGSNLAPELLHAVIAAESAYDPLARSPKGAIGLMQLMPATAWRFGADDPYSVRENVQAGAAYLKWLMALFENDLELVLAAYNAGEQAVLRAGRRVPPYPETQAYVPRVLAYLRCAKTMGCKPG